MSPNHASVSPNRKTLEICLSEPKSDTAQLHLCLTRKNLVEIFERLYSNEVGTIIIFPKLVEENFTKYVLPTKFVPEQDFDYCKYYLTEVDKLLNESGDIQKDQF